MGLMSKSLFRDHGAGEPGVMTAYFQIDTTTSGTISAASVAGSLTRALPSGITLVKTAAKTGRYTLTFQGLFVRLLAGGVLVEGAADAAYTAAKATAGFIRGRSPTTGIIYVQMYRTDTFADAEVEDAANIFGWMDIQLSKARDR